MAVLDVVVTALLARGIARQPARLAQPGEPGPPPGHQAYVHKLVTGRRAGFAELRQADGLSGYPSREESRHDYVENSHASTILSYAYGLAVARDAGVDPHRHIVAVIGDGSMTGGMAYEALNNLGHSQRRVIVVLNDNGRSCDGEHASQGVRVRQ